MKQIAELICANALDLANIPQLDIYSHFCNISKTDQSYKYIITEDGKRFETEGPMKETASWYVGGILEGMTNNGTDLLVLQNSLKRIVNYKTDGLTNVSEFDMSSLRENFSAIDYGNREVFVFGIYGGRRRIYYAAKGAAFNYLVIRTNDGTVFSAPNGMVITDNKLYLSNKNKIWAARFRLSSLPPSPNLKPWLEFPTGFLITAMTSNNKNIFAYEQTRKIVIKITKATKKYEIYFAPGLNNVQGMTWLNKKFYFVENTAKKIHRYELKPKNLIK